MAWGGCCPAAGFGTTGPLIRTNVGCKFTGYDEFPVHGSCMLLPCTFALCVHTVAWMWLVEAPGVVCVCLLVEAPGVERRSMPAESKANEITARNQGEGRPTQVCLERAPDHKGVTLPRIHYARVLTQRT